MARAKLQTNQPALFISLFFALINIIVSGIVSMWILDNTTLPPYVAYAVVGVPLVLFLLFTGIRVVMYSPLIPETPFHPMAAGLDRYYMNLIYDWLYYDDPDIFIMSKTAPKYNILHWILLILVIIPVFGIIVYIFTTTPMKITDNLWMINKKGYCYDINLSEMETYEFLSFYCKSTTKTTIAGGGMQAGMIRNTNPRKEENQPTQEQLQAQQAAMKSYL